MTKEGDILDTIKENVKPQNYKKNEIDMLHGSLWNKILLFALPLALSSILQQLFNACDVAVAGHFAEKHALAAVGANGPVVAVFINFFVGCSIGPNVTVATLIGQKREDEIPIVVHTVMTFSVLAGIGFLIFSEWIGCFILEVTGTPAEVMDLSLQYLRVYLIGLPFSLIYNFGAAILRSVGDSKRPLYILLLSGIVNVICNLFFVIVLHMGVIGVSIATVIATMLSAIVVVILLMKEQSWLHFDIRKCGIDGRVLSRVLMIGVPAGLQGLVFSISNICVQSGINSLGPAVMSGSSAELNYEYICYFIVAAFNQTAVTFTSQNYGAMQYDRCKKVLKQCMFFGVFICMSLCALVVVFRYPLLSVFTSDEEIMKYAVIRVTHVVALEFLTASYEIPGASLRAMGHSVAPAVITVMGSCVLRLIWLYTVFAQHHTFGTLMSIYPISWVFTGVAMITTYCLLRKQLYGR